MRTGATLRTNVADPVLEVYSGGTGTLNTVTTTAAALPTTNLTGRKAIIIQNLDDTALLRIRVDRPDVIMSPHRYANKETNLKWANDYSNDIRWFKSGSGTNEYYAAKYDKTTLSITEPLRMYGITSAGGSESLLTNGTAGALNNLEWDFGNTDTLGFNTVYIRYNAGDPNEARDFMVLLSYTVMPDASSAYGVTIYPHNTFGLSLEGSARVHAYAGSSINVFTQELL